MPEEAEFDTSASLFPPPPQSAAGGRSRTHMLSVLGERLFLGAVLLRLL